MRHAPIDPGLFVSNRRRLAQLLPPHSLAIVNTNDIFPTNSDGRSDRPKLRLFYLTGVEQESVLLMFPDASDERQRGDLFLRERATSSPPGRDTSSPATRPVSGPGSVASSGCRNCPTCCGS